MRRNVIVFDGDDTLWYVEPLYDEARIEAAAIVGGAGLDAGHWESLQRRIDVRYVPHYGVSSKQFPQSCAEAYRRLALQSAHGVDPSVEALVRDAARSVFARTAPPVSEAGKILDLLRGHFQIALLTKGEEEVQRKRIVDAGLTEAFDHVAIVPSKGEREFSQVLAVFGVSAGFGWSVGNSLASDINPALRIGMRAIWIDAHVWEYGRRESRVGDGFVISAPDLSSTAQILLQQISDIHLADAEEASRMGGHPH